MAQVGRKGIGDAPIFFVPAIVIRLARLGQKLEAIEGSALVVRRMDVSSPAYRSSCSLKRCARKFLVFFTLRGSQEAIGGYLAGSGAPPAAVRVSRRPWTVPRRHSLARE